MHLNFYLLFYMLHATISTATSCNYSTSPNTYIYLHANLSCSGFFLFPSFLLSFNLSFNSLLRAGYSSFLCGSYFLVVLYVSLPFCGSSLRLQQVSLQQQILLGFQKRTSSCAFPSSVLLFCCFHYLLFIQCCLVRVVLSGFTSCLTLSHPIFQ